MTDAPQTNDVSTDPLTGLADRRTLRQRLAARLEKPAEAFGVLFLDLDGFKAVNDRLGHLAGDRVLVELAQRLAQSVRPADLVARFGGDEFVVLLENVRSPADAQTIARRIASQVERPLVLGEQLLAVRASIGIVPDGREYQQPDELLQAADQAMYRAKAQKNAQAPPTAAENPPPDPLAILQVVETALYAEDLERAEAFYRDVLGLKPVGKQPGRHVFFPAGARSMLLVFRAEASMEAGDLPAHGARGPGHVALGIAAEAVEAWQSRLEALGVALERSVRWPHGAQSLYFRDPAGNLVELITPGAWGLSSGW